MGIYTKLLSLPPSPPSSSPRSLPPPTPSSSNTYIDVLDGTRVHPDTYEWARKMAVDALEYDEVNSKCHK